MVVLRVVAGDSSVPLNGPCGRLNVIGLHNLIGSGTIKRHGFAGVGVTLMEGVCDCGGGL